MRKESTNYTAPKIEKLDFYHHGNFETLTFFNSDRKIKVTENYKVSRDNTPSTLSIMAAGSDIKAFGIELETMSPLARVSETALANVLYMVFERSGFDPDFFKKEEDCTVSAECVSQTFSKGWMRNNYKCFKAMYEMFSQLAITTNDYHCGMHVNIDLSNFGSDRQTQIDNVRKIGYMINKHYKFFKKAFHRLDVPTNETNWAVQMNDSKDYWKNTPVENFPTAHNQCNINMGHVNKGRVEIRLVGGQKDFGCFRNTMETVFFLVEKVSKLSWDDIDDLVKIFKGCNEKVFDRLKTNCFQAGTITSEQLERIRPTVKPYKGL